MASSEEESEDRLSLLVSARGVNTQRHVDALYSKSKHFGPGAKHKAALSTGIAVEYAIHENEVKVEDAPEERVVLIMGFMTIKEAWTPLIDMLLHNWDDAVEHKRNVKLVSFDNRGLGGSDVPWWRYTTSGMAQDALALMDFLEWDTAHVVGISMGGMISQELALAAPQRVKSLSLMVTTRGKYVEDPRSKEPMKESLNAKEPEDIAKSQLNLLFSDAYLDQSMSFGDKTRREVMYEYLLARAKERVKPRFLGMVNQLLAIRTHWISDERLAAINASGFPILLVGGAMDILIPPREMQTLRGHLKGDHVETLFFEQGGHGVFIQYPEEVAVGLTKLFLRS
ncbi:putative non-heme bromoperoxidase BpoC [Phytophthora ramorum]|uniref:AB hydrolase-1 domain-containing protein n=1 Tax=Phytophthora ramorum TaxID=164328 RepID=H3GEP7_PHYRM|nr:putative non-heme bromoperoxidase BpoC [Phytophthora ramorum]